MRDWEDECFRTRTRPSDVELEVYDSGLGLRHGRTSLEAPPDQRSLVVIGSWIERLKQSPTLRKPNVTDVS